MKEEKGDVGIFKKYIAEEGELYRSHQEDLARVENPSIEEAKAILSDSYEEKKVADDIKRKQKNAVEEIQNIANKVPAANVIDGIKTPRFDMALKIALLGREAAHGLLEEVSDHQTELDEANYALHLGYTKNENAFISIYNAIKLRTIKGDMKINGLEFSKWDQNDDNPFNDVFTKKVVAISPDVIKIIEDSDYNVEKMFDTHFKSIMFIDEPGRLAESSTNIKSGAMSQVEGAIKQMRALGFEEAANAWETKAQKVFEDANSSADQL